MDIQSIVVAYQGVKAAKEIAGGIINLKIETEVNLKINEILGMLNKAVDDIFAARETMLALQDENSVLKTQLADAKSWEGELAKLKLYKTPADGVVYRAATPFEHFICPRCVSDRKQIHPLQSTGPYAGTGVCPSCSASYSLSVPKKINTMPSRGGTDF